MEALVTFNRSFYDTNFYNLNYIRLTHEWSDSAKEWKIIKLRMPTLHSLIFYVALFS